jgi:hypothetical protein
MVYIYVLNRAIFYFWTNMDPENTFMFYAKLQYFWSSAGKKRENDVKV